MAAALELVLIAAIFLGANVWNVLPVSETPWIFALGWASLRLRRKGWGSVGLVRPPSWPRTLAIALSAAIGLQLLSTYVTEPLITLVTHRPTDLSRFRPLVGNLRLALTFLPVIWILAAFGEEMVYRGYVLNRAADLGGRTARAWVLSYLAVSLMFGLGHLYQGPTGVADTTITGLWMGGLYLASGRNLWLPILTHGLSDTIALFLVYFDLVPAVYR